MARYEIRNKDVTLLEFGMRQDVADSPWGPVDVRSIDGVEVVSTDGALPTGIERETDAAGVKRWLEERRSPFSRKHMDKLFHALGIQTHEAYIIRSLGLSLGDTYWTVPSGSPLKWGDVSLYRHPFPEVVSSLALSGLQETLIPQDGPQLSPELSTNGALPKCWMWRDGKISLIKGQSDPFGNMGREAFSEYYMSQVAAAAGLEHVSYDLISLRGPQGGDAIFSVCPLFTSEEHGYEPMASLLRPEERSASGKELLSVCARHIDPDDLADMLVFDAVIGNTDRHLNNFGAMRDNDTGKIVGTAPLFDHGMSLLNTLVWHKDPALDEFRRIEEAVMRGKGDPYTGSFMETVRFVGGPRQRAMLERLADFQFTPHETFRACQEMLEPLGAHIRATARSYVSIISHKTARTAMPIEPPELTEEEIRALGLVEDPIIHLRPRTDGQTYKGEVVHVDEERGYIVQRSGRRSLFVHRTDRLDRVPGVGEEIKISYPREEGPKASVTEEQVRKRSRSR
ncbi:MAG: HipA domain-containing protein [Synergistaceae bacterium]|nr:HipA domain-containing protein [Synergistaceae bacterium]